MTEDLEKALKRELASAKAKPDPEERHEAILTAQANMLEALVECQRKTADRVKQIVEGSNAARYKLEGAQLAWRIFRYLAAGGAGAAIVKFASVSAGAQ
jgi:hypothetical protein